MTRGTDVTDMQKKYRTALPGEFPEELNLKLKRIKDLRYGENPNQPAALYASNQILSIDEVKTGKGGVSATNLMDVARALDVLKFFQKPSAAVMKHLVPSGFATQFEGRSLAETYKLARDADARSAFGSVVVFNAPVDKSTADELMTSYVEGIAAPQFEEGVMGIFEKKKDLRVFEYKNLDKLPKFTGDDTKGLYDMKVLPGGFVVAQVPYLSSIKGEKDLILDPMVRREDGKEFTVKRNPTQRELEDMLTAWWINIGVRSNGIVIVKDGVTLAVGTGQQERVGAVEQAIVKGYQKEHDRIGMDYDPLMGINIRDEKLMIPLKDSVISSDAYFPFRDSIDTLARAGVSAVIQPGGSKRDSEVIEAVNEHGMAMAYTLERCFSHF